MEWAYACLDYGQLVEDRGETELGTSIARSTQARAWEVLGEAESAGVEDQRSRARRQEQPGFADRAAPQVDALYSQRILDLMLSTPNLFFSYLAAIRSEGESSARRRIVAEIEQLVSQQPELLCD